MRRDFSSLRERRFDLLVVGGGIHGALVARDAALRGLCVALVERDDFGAATSANSQKTIHGGLRYWQHLDVARVRESIRERRTWRRVAAPWVRPLPVVIPTYGHGLRGRELLAAARLLHDLAGVGAGSEPADTTEPPTGRLSRAEVLRLVPGIEERGLTGGFVFHDAQVEDTERLLLAIVRSAADRDAVVVNHAEATELVREGPNVVGMLVRDRIDGEIATIRAAAVVNACGPWAEAFLDRAGVDRARPRVRLARGFNVITRRLFPHAVGLYGRRGHDDPDAVVHRGGRLLFLVPWRDRTILGTEFRPHDETSPTEEDRSSLAAAVAAFLREISEACPRLALGPGDVTLVHEGLVPMASATHDGQVRLLKQFELRDHAGEGTPGLFSVIGVKYTTARDVAERLVDRVVRSLGRGARRSRSAESPLPEDPPWRGALDGPEGLARATRSAIREEMAVTLADVVRRLGVGAAQRPATETVDLLASVAGEELGWSDERRAEEIRALEARYTMASTGGSITGSTGSSGGSGKSGSSSGPGGRTDGSPISR